MIDNPFEMVVLIVLICSIAGVLTSRYKAKGERPAIVDDPDSARLREQVQVLKDRVAVLERIATDKNHRLEAEFERLRDER